MYALLLIYCVKNFVQISANSNYFYHTASFGILDYPMCFMLELVMVLVGSVFLYDCQAQPKLPIFLISMGKYILVLCFKSKSSPIVFLILRCCRIASTTGGPNWLEHWKHKESLRLPSADFHDRLVHRW